MCAGRNEKEMCNIVVIVQSSSSAFQQMFPNLINISFDRTEKGSDKRAYSNYYDPSPSQVGLWRLHSEVRFVRSRFKEARRSKQMKQVRVQRQPRVGPVLVAAHDDSVRHEAARRGVDQRDQSIWVIASDSRHLGGEWIMNWSFPQTSRGSFSAVSTPIFASNTRWN